MKNSTQIYFYYIRPSLSYKFIPIYIFFPYFKLKSLLRRSIEEFVNLFDPNNGHQLPLFRMTLTFDEEKMEIYPTLQDLEAFILEILNAIANTLQVRLCICTAHLKENEHTLADFYLKNVF